jgi:hypothetical protein
MSGGEGALFFSCEGNKINYTNKNIKIKAYSKENSKSKLME